VSKSGITPANGSTRWRGIAKNPIYLHYFAPRQFTFTQFCVYNGPSTFEVLMRYHFEELQIDESGIVHASGFAEIENEGDEWWVSAIYTEVEVGAVPAVHEFKGGNNFGAPIYKTTPRIPGKIVRKDMEKSEPYYAAILCALEEKHGAYITDKVFGDSPSRDDEHSTLNFNQQGIR
jgi:hypothetical protein